MADGTLKVGTITTSSGSGTITIPSGVTMTGQNYPAFEAKRGSTQTLTNDTNVKVQADTEILDTDNCYDNSTNYRFTPNKAGKYLVYASVRGGANTGLTSVDKVTLMIYKNGSKYDNRDQRIDFRNNQGTAATVAFSAILDLNGTTDYIELYANVDVTANSAVLYHSSTFFGAYRLGA